MVWSLLGAAFMALRLPLISTRTASRKSNCVRGNAANSASLDSGSPN
jgi:hypothetical protein